MASAVSNGIMVKSEAMDDLSENGETKMDPTSDDDVPLVMKMKSKKKRKESKRKPSESDDDSEPVRKKVKKEKPSNSKAANHVVKKEPKEVKKENGDSQKKGKKEAEDVWRWWEEEKLQGGVRWKFLEHKGPVFPPAYEPLPKSVKFYYDGKHMKLSEPAEEVAYFYARMLDHEYTTKDIFNKNFFHDWRSVMSSEEKHTITTLDKCNFKEMHAHALQKTEERKNMTKEEKNKIKEDNQKIQNEFGFCIMDGHKQKIANFRIEPPGLFRGRGNHPKMGMLKKRVRPEDIIINCSRNSKIPEAPPGTRWKEIRYDQKVTWLACWVENVQGNFKYVMLNASSRLKGEKDWKKYETARKLHKIVDKIRASYHNDFKSREMRIRQRAVALYFIDKLALRAGNEKDEDEADTVGCCSLRFEHITLHKEFDGQKYVVEFDFLGKDSIRYNNKVPVLKRVFKNLKLFMENKKEGDDLFDRLNTTVLNAYLKELMDNLTAKVFRTYNASKTLEDQLNLMTKKDDDLPNKLLAYNRANRAVAVLCNHQRAVPKSFQKAMENIQQKINDKKEQIHDVRREAKKIKADFKRQKSAKLKAEYEKKKKRLKQLEEQLNKLEVQATDKDENKDIALGTSKLNYLDPRISVAWCKKWGVPIERVYSKTHRDKFQWAIDMADADYVFQDVDSDKRNDSSLKEEVEDDEEDEE